MAMVVVLFPGSRLGVTSIALLRDDSLTGLVLEGWAFHARDASRAAHAVAGVRNGVRMLQPFAHAAVSFTAETNVIRREEAMDRERIRPLEKRRRQ